MDLIGTRILQTLKLIIYSSSFKSILFKIRYVGRKVKQKIRLYSACAVATCFRPLKHPETSFILHNVVERFNWVHSLFQYIIDFYKSNAAASIRDNKAIKQAIVKSLPTCSKLIMSLVDATLKFQKYCRRKHCYHLPQKMSRHLIVVEES